jgi:hypothetical protein
MELPQRFGNNRIAPSDESVTTATKLGLVLFVASTYWYKKQFLRKEKDYFNLTLFGFGSLLSSMAIARFFFESPYAAAARRNNWNELKHQRQIRHI